MFDNVAQVFVKRGKLRGLLSATIAQRLSRDAPGAASVAPWQATANQISGSFGDFATPKVGIQ